EKPEHPILTEGSETKIGNGMATYVLFRLDCLRHFPLMHFVMQILVFKLHPSSLFIGRPLCLLFGGFQGGDAPLQIDQAFLSFSSCLYFSLGVSIQRLK